MRPMNSTTSLPMINFKGHRFEKDIILLCVRWYLAYPLSYRTLEEMIEERGVEVDHSNIYRWVQKFTPQLESSFRKGKKRPVGKNWRMDETYRYCWRTQIRGIFIPPARVFSRSTETLLPHWSLFALVLGNPFPLAGVRQQYPTVFETPIRLNPISKTTTKASTVLMMNLSETNSAARLAEQDARHLLASTTRAPGRPRRDESQSGLDSHLVRPHPEALQDARPERGTEGDIDRVPAPRHQDASDARHVVPRVEGIPMPIEPRLEPGGKVH